MEEYRKEYLKAIKRGIKRHIEECEHMVEVSYEKENDYGEKSREHWLKEKEESEEKLERLEREYGSVNEEEEIEGNREKDSREEEFTEEDEKRAREEGWDSASQAREWKRSSKQMDKLRKEMSKNAKLRIVEDLWAVGLSPEEVYGVGEEYDELVEEAAGRKEDEEDVDDEEEDEEVF